jgi:hypothetical protein
LLKKLITDNQLPVLQVKAMQTSTGTSAQNKVPTSTGTSTQKQTTMNTRITKDKSKQQYQDYL